MEWYEKMINVAKQTIRDKKTVAPMFFMKLENGGLNILSLDAFAHDKDLMALVMRTFVYKKNPKEYLFITESFVKMVDQKDQADEAIGQLVANGTLQVSQLPSSQDAIVALYGNRKSEKLGMITFQRKGKTVKFHPVKWLEGDELKGRFANLRGRL